MKDKRNIRDELGCGDGICRRWRRFCRQLTVHARRKARQTNNLLKRAKMTEEAEEAEGGAEGAEGAEEAQEA